MLDSLGHIHSFLTYSKLTLAGNNIVFYPATLLAGESVKFSPNVTGYAVITLDFMNVKSISNIKIYLPHLSIIPIFFITKCRSRMVMYAISNGANRDLIFFSNAV